jgi:arylsulfatase A
MGMNYLMNVEKIRWTAMALTLVVSSYLQTSAQQKKPNVIFILADDLGWSDLSCYGNPIIQTPNIDKLAQQGMKFTNAYACPVCAPTRASMQTGQYSARLQMTDVSNGHVRPWGKLIPPKVFWRLNTDHITIAEAIKKAGYVSGLFGKWHLGYDDQHQPEDQGYIYPENKPFQGNYASKLDAWVKANPYKGIGNNVKQCVQFIEQNKENPFFCIASFSAVHTRPEARQDLIDKYKKIVATNRTTIDPVYAGMCEMMDESVGLFQEVLKDLGLLDNTLVIFFSDNGGVVEERGYLFHGYENLVTTNWPLRDEKGTLYEGGIRVPFIACWPGKIEEGSVNQTPVHVVDLFPTMLDLTGSSKPQGKIFDGISWMPLLKNKNLKPERDLVWHYPHYHHSTPASAIRSGDFKLIYFYETAKAEVYNLKNDIGEQYDLADSLPAKRDELQYKLNKWLKEVNAGMPLENPHYDPNRELIWGERIQTTKLLKGNTYGFGLE